MCTCRQLLFLFTLTVLKYEFLQSILICWTKKKVITVYGGEQIMNFSVIWRIKYSVKLLQPNELIRQISFLFSPGGFKRLWQKKNLQNSPTYIWTNKWKLPKRVERVREWTRKEKKKRTTSRNSAPQVHQILVQPTRERRE